MLFFKTMHQEVILKGEGRGQELLAAQANESVNSLVHHRKP